MVSTLQYFKEKLFPYRVEDDGHSYVVSGGRPNKVFYYKVTKAFVVGISDKDAVVELITRNLNYTIERDIIKTRYEQVLNNDNKSRTNNDEIIIVDSLAPQEENMLLIHPETYKQLLVAGKVTHTMGKRKKVSRKKIDDWKKILEGETCENK